MAAVDNQFSGVVNNFMEMELLIQTIWHRIKPQHDSQSLLIWHHRGVGEMYETSFLHYIFHLSENWQLKIIFLWLLLMQQSKNSISYFVWIQNKKQKDPPVVKRLQALCNIMQTGNMQLVLLWSLSFKITTTTKSFFCMPIIFLWIAHYLSSSLVLFGILYIINNTSILCYILYMYLCRPTSSA